VAAYYSSSSSDQQLAELSRQIDPRPASASSQPLPGRVSASPSTIPIGRPVLGPRPCGAMPCFMPGGCGRMAQIEAEGWQRCRPAWSSSDSAALIFHPRWRRARNSPVAPTEAGRPWCAGDQTVRDCRRPGKRPLAFRGLGARRWRRPAPICPQSMNERIKSVVSIALFVLCWPEFGPSAYAPWPCDLAAASEPAESRAAPQNRRSCPPGSPIPPIHSLPIQRKDLPAHEQRPCRSRLLSLRRHYGGR